MPFPGMYNKSTIFNPMEESQMKSVVEASSVMSPTVDGPGQESKIVGPKIERDEVYYFDSVIFLVS